MTEQAVPQPPLQAAKADPAAAKPLRRLNATRADLIAALLSYPIAYAYVRLLFLGGYAWGLLAFSVLFLAGTEVYFRARGRRGASRESRFFALCLLLTALARALFHGQTVAGYDMLFAHALACYVVLDRAGLLTGGEAGPFAPLDLISAAVIVPLSNFVLRARLFAAWLSNRRARREAAGKAKGVAVLLAGLAGLALFFLAARILSRADPFFGERIGSFFGFELRLDGIVWGSLVLSVPVGSYLFGLTGGALQRERPPFSAVAVRASAERLRAVPDGVAAGVLAAFAALYALFFAFQGSYLFGALRGALPAGFTAAEYARQGFFELCEIVALSFLLLTACAKTVKSPLREHAALRALSLTLLACSLLFALVAGSKMALYVTRFGLTQSRILASFFMLVLSLLTCLAAADILRPFRAVRAGLLLTALLFALLCLSDPDARIIDVNLAQYARGTVHTLDVEYLAEECGAREDPVKFYRQLAEAGYFDAPRTADELRVAFGQARIAKLPDGTLRHTWAGPRGGAVSAVVQNGSVVSIGPAEGR